jgi:hypothetical protein
MNPLASLVIEALVDFVITGGSALVGYMTANGQLTMPSTPAVIVAVITGLIGAANQVRGVMRDWRGGA